MLNVSENFPKSNGIIGIGISKIFQIKQKDWYN
jgi:hypothetical protein